MTADARDAVATDAGGELVTYAYAVTRTAHGLTDAVTALTGVAEAPVRVVREPAAPGLAIAVSPVPARDFDESALRRNLEDLDWLAAVARAHHAVVDALATVTVVLPLRLATVYLDDPSAGRVLGERGPALAAALDRLAGHEEWGVKVYAVKGGEPVPAAGAEAGRARGSPAPPSASPAPSADPSVAFPAGDSPTPGRTYLRRRRAQEDAREAVHRAAVTAAARVESAAAPYAAARARHRPQSGSLAATTDENVVNDAYLVPVACGLPFRESVARAADGLDGVRVTVTGPWAPYSFTGEVPVGADAPGGAGGGGRT
ncbi:GvpL/GvpF family gas vesicle protein [Streptomyces sp. NPDC091281]|uniref:GvpL/GvpF family gas vesicle protein n=1 Tax=Streptomyces sp. NPDC091281 TaxID=3365985 RepID=UPI0037FE8300